MKWVYQKRERVGYIKMVTFVDKFEVLQIMLVPMVKECKYSYYVVTESKSDCSGISLSQAKASI